MGNQIAEDAYQMGLSTGEWMERERIIALLEAACVDDPECTTKPCGCYQWEIALIKGENE